MNGIFSADTPRIDSARIVNLYLSFSHGDAEAIDQLFTDNVVSHLIGDTLLAADYAGKDALREFMARTIEMNHTSRYKLEIEDVLEGRRHISVLGRVIVQAEGSSQASIIRMHDVLRVDDNNKVDEMWSMVV